MENIFLLEPGKQYSITAENLQNPIRIDVFLTEKFPSASRSHFKKMIELAVVKLNNQVIKKSSAIIKNNDLIQFAIPNIVLETVNTEKIQNLDVEVVYEHEHFLIVYKPANLVVHMPRSGSKDVTLVDWLVQHFNDIKDVGAMGRPGIVHRLDKDTSGILVIPRNNYSHAIFGNMFKERHIKKTYLAVVQGTPEQSGIIDFRITRSNTHKHKMTHTNRHGREAVTEYKVLKYFNDAALVEVKPVTGRTHQIRVHFSAIGCPLIGDQLYGKKSKLISRQALHAYNLSFNFQGADFSFSKEAPADFQKLIEELEEIKL